MPPPGRPSPRGRRAAGSNAGPALVPGAVLGAVLLAAGCGSPHAKVSSGSTAAPPTSAPATTTATTVAHQVPTVPNCGGGAYKPATLLIVCGDDTTMATGVSWQSWDATGAAGTGTVRLNAGGTAKTAAARLALSDVVQGGVGPQFSVLTVTWSATSPDGHPTDVFRLSPGG